MESLDLVPLVSYVRDESTTDEPLDQLATAASIRNQLAETAEALLDHFVQEARSAGCSWTQVGDALGVSKQAAHQRATAPSTIARVLMTRLRSTFSSSPGGGLFGRTSDETREVALRARAVALELRHPQIDTGHLLLGLVAGSDGVVRDTLREAAIREGDVRAELLKREQAAGPVEALAFSPEAEKVMELALRESLRLRSKEIRPEHVLLGLLRERRGTGGAILDGLGVDHRTMRQSVEDRIVTAR